MANVTARRRAQVRGELNTETTEVCYFCRTCKGHNSQLVDIGAFRSMRCRCGSGDLLVYQLTAEPAAPLRPKA